MQARRMSRSGLLSAGLCFLACLVLGVAAYGKDAGKANEVRSITMACAASLTDVMEEAGKAFTGKTGIQVEFEFGSSGSLARKVLADAPIDVFLSANFQWVKYLQDKGRVEADGAALVALNTLVCVVPAGAKHTPAAASDLAGLRKVALGDPEHVPAGAYARQALISQGVWDSLNDKDKMVLSQDVRAALMLVEQGQVDAGIVYSTDAALSGKVKVAFTFPPESHDPIDYYAAAIKTGAKLDASRKLVEFLKGPEFLKILAKNGFEIPKQN